VAGTAAGGESPTDESQHSWCWASRPISLPRLPHLAVFLVSIRRFPAFQMVFSILEFEQES